MKNFNYGFAIATFSTVSCNKKKNSKATTEHEGHNHKEGEAHKLLMNVQMDCEKVKRTIKGNCPVCKMELIEAKVDSHEGHDHSKENQ